MCVCVSVGHVWSLGLRLRVFEVNVESVGATRVQTTPLTSHALIPGIPWRRQRCMFVCRPSDKSEMSEVPDWGLIKSSDR